MADYNGLIAKIEEQTDTIEKLENAFARMTISRAANFERSKSVAAKLVLLADKIREIQKMQKEATEKAQAGGDTLEEDGFSIFKKMMDMVPEENEDLILGIISDFFGITHDEARIIPLSIIYENIVRDKVVLTVFPRLALLVAQAQSNILPNAPASHSPPTPFTSNQDGKKSLTNVTKNTNG